MLFPEVIWGEFGRVLEQMDRWRKMDSVLLGLNFKELLLTYLSILYKSEILFEIFNKYPDINFHSYADDLQINFNSTDSPAYCPDRISNY